MPLSDTNISGIPCVEKTLSKAAIVEVVVACLSEMTSGHFEWVSRMIRYVQLSIGPAKPTWRGVHGFSALCHGTNFWRTGYFAARWHLLRCFTGLSMSLSMPGQYAYDYAIDFIWLIPGCREWNYCRAAFLSIPRMTTHSECVKQESTTGRPSIDNQGCIRALACSNTKFATHNPQTKTLLTPR